MRSSDEATSVVMTGRQRGRRASRSPRFAEGLPSGPAGSGRRSAGATRREVEGFGARRMVTPTDVADADAVEDAAPGSSPARAR